MRLRQPRSDQRHKRKTYRGTTTAMTIHFIGLLLGLVDEGARDDRRCAADARSSRPLIAASRSTGVSRATSASTRAGSRTERRRECARPRSSTGRGRGAGLRCPGTSRHIPCVQPIDASDIVAGHHAHMPGQTVHGGRIDLVEVIEDAGLMPAQQPPRFADRRRGACGRRNRFADRAPSAVSRRWKSQSWRVAGCWLQ